MQCKLEHGLSLRCKRSWPKRDTDLIEEANLAPSNDAASS